MDWTSGDAFISPFQRRKITSMSVQIHVKLGNRSVLFQIEKIKEFLESVQ